jgi:hypothetical protein
MWISKKKFLELRSQLWDQSIMNKALSSSLDNFKNVHKENQVLQGKFDKLAEICWKYHPNRNDIYVGKTYATIIGERILSLEIELKENQANLDKEKELLLKLSEDIEKGNKLRKKSNGHK